MQSQHALLLKLFEVTSDFVQRACTHYKLTWYAFQVGVFRGHSWSHLGFMAAHYGI